MNGPDGGTALSVSEAELRAELVALLREARALFADLRGLIADERAGTAPGRRR